ncbi:MAG: serine/threonine protein kinase [Chloroflexi bacterium]|nr:MAG: serine/threonine protein kinase [Chloroflexota bacterium]
MPTIGETLAGRFRIDASLGAGGMASVFRARDLRLDRDVAIKVLAPNLAVDPILSERFDREARALAAISHPNVVAIYDVEPGDPATGREPFFVMELCSGGSLANRVNRAGGRLPPNDLVPIVAAVAGGLDALHEAGLVHRDVKPHNVLLASDRARLGDLGLARPGDAAEWDGLTTTGAAIGTLAYIAPERLAGGSATAAGDVWSLGAMTYQSLTGQLPRPAATVAELVDRRLEPPLPPSSVDPSLGTAFDRPLLAALDAEPSARPSALAFAGLLVGALGKWSRDEGGGAHPVTPAARPVAPAGAVPPAVIAAAAPADPGATTALHPLPPPVRRGRDGDRPTSNRWPIAVGALAGLLAALVIVGILLSNRGAALGPSGSAAAGGSPSVVASASPSPSLSPSPSPTATPPPTPTPDAFADARARLADVRTAIEAAKGGDGLKGKEANTLFALANDVDQAIRARDESKAGSAADRLLAQVRKDISERRVTGARASRLLDAAQALRDAIPSS